VPRASSQRIKRYAADHDLPVAVRATGHGPVAGVDGGMLIDIRALT
jgi:hypothetical protein